MQTILITGAAGFIGSHLSRRLLAEGNRIIAVDNFMTGRRGNLQPLMENERFTLVEHDVCNALPELPTPDIIYHLACPASPPAYQADPIKTMLTNVLGTRNLLELAQASNAVMLHASTSEIYGDPEIHPQPESYCGNVNTLGPRACYDEGKRAAETLCMDYHRSHGVRVKLVRIFNTYGPMMREDDGRVVSNFICQALAGHPLTIYGDGSQTRSFCYVDDLADGLLQMVATADGIIGPVNLGNPDEFTMLELADKVLRLTGSSSELVFKPLPTDDPRQRQPDITLAKELLGFEPKVNLKRGLTKTVAYFKTVHALSQHSTQQ